MFLPSACQYFLDTEKGPGPRPQGGSGDRLGRSRVNGFGSKEQGAQQRFHIYMLSPAAGPLRPPPRVGVGDLLSPLEMA